MKYLLSFCLLLTTYHLNADVPGNKPRPSYEVKFTGLNQYNNYLFFFQDNNIVSSLKDSSKIHVQGGYGAPGCVEVWAINKNNLKHTDTLYFCSGDEKNSKTVTVNIYQNKLTATSVSSKGKEENMPPVSSVNNKDDGNDQFVNNYRIMYLIAAWSFLLLIIRFIFFRNKNKKPVLNQSL